MVFCFTYYTNSRHYSIYFILFVSYNKVINILCAFEQCFHTLIDKNKYTNLNQPQVDVKGCVVSCDYNATVGCCCYYSFL